MRPDEWRDTLVSRLDARWSQLQTYDRYYEGNQILAYAMQRFRDRYGGLFRELSNNWCRLVVDASVERLNVQGFRFGPNEDADDDAWAIWQANNLDGESNMLHTEAVKLGEAYWMVAPGDDFPLITAEHPSQVIVATDKADRRKRLAALKKWLGDDGWTYANVDLPDQIVKWRIDRVPLFAGLQVDDRQHSVGTRWEPVARMSNPLGVVPIVPMPNNPSLLRGGTSDLSGGILTIQDAINKEMADMLVGSENTAYRQRVLLGIDQPVDSDGKPIPLEQVLNSSLWMFPGKDGSAFEFSATELSNFREAIDGLVRDLTAQSRTPPHYVSGQIVNASGDALKAAETGLVAKVRDKMMPFGEGHEEAMRLAFLSIDRNDPRAQALDAETIWKDPESRTMAETVDAAIKLKGLLPDEMIMERIGMSPQEIDRALSIREAERLANEALGIPPAPTAPPQDAATPAPPQSAPAAPGTPAP